MTTIFASLLTLLHPAAPACNAPHLEPVQYAHFALCHDSERKVPIWVAYQLTPAQVQPVSETQPRPRFRRDSNLVLPAATDADYRNTPYTRGHMAPAADFAFSEKARRATFVLSNAAPQTPSLNLGRWSQLEAAVRRIAADSDSITVVTGPIFDPSVDPQFIGSNRVAIPTHFFKVVLATRGHQRTAYAAILPNSTNKLAELTAYATTVDEVERRTGLDFFSFLPDLEETALESESPSFIASLPAKRI